MNIDKMRLSGAKVRTGCTTCKLRHVKCDETKPLCNRCIKAGRVCGGYSPATSPSPLPIGHKFIHYVERDQVDRLSRSPSPFVDFDSPSLRAWNFFLNATALQLQRPSAAKLWSEHLTRLARSNGAIKHGIVAVASLHENFMSLSDSETASARRVLALEHYSKSIREVVHANQRDQRSAVLTTLVSSLLFCAIESVQGHMSSAMKHISAGLSLLAEYESTALLADSEENRALPGFAQVLRGTFFELAGQSLSYEDRTILNNAKLVEYLRRPRTTSESPPTSIETAAQGLTNLFNDILLFMTWSESRQKDVDFPAPDLVEARNELQARYEAWIQTYHELLAASSRHFSDDNSERQALLELRVNQITCRICLKVTFDQGQTAFDRCRPEFEAVVQASEDLMILDSCGTSNTKSPSRSRSPSTLPRNSFRMGLGVIPGILFACTKCRDQPLRYRALKVLKNIKRRESIWDSDTVGAVAERFVAIEERNAREYWQQQGYQRNMDAEVCDQGQGVSLNPCAAQLSIPESARIHAMVVDLPDDDDDDSQARVAFLRSGDPDNHPVEYLLRLQPAPQFSGQEIGVAEFVYR